MRMTIHSWYLRAWTQPDLTFQKAIKSGIISWWGYRPGGRKSSMKNIGTRSRKTQTIKLICLFATIWVWSSRLHRRWISSILPSRGYVEDNELDTETLLINLLDYARLYRILLTGKIGDKRQSSCIYPWTVWKRPLPVRFSLKFCVSIKKAHFLWTMWWMCSLRLRIIFFDGLIYKW